jgi:hypothetical protein
MSPSPRPFPAGRFASFRPNRIHHEDQLPPSQLMHLWIKLSLNKRGGNTWLLLLVDDIVNQCSDKLWQCSDKLWRCSGKLWRSVSAKKMEPQITQMNANEARNNALSRLVIGCALAVANTLGSGPIEKVYENALVHELCKSGLAVAQ